MQKSCKILSLILIVVVASFSFAGCSTKRELKKASKGLTSYSIDAVFCDSEKKITAIEEILYIHNYEQKIDKLALNLYGRAFREDANIKPYSKTKIGDCFPNGVNYGDLIINSVMVNNKAVEFIYCGLDDNAIEIPLGETLAKGDKITINIDFSLNLANCTHRLGYNEGKVNLGNWYPVVACLNEDGYAVEPYWQNGDPFYSNIANYNVKLSYPAKYNLSATGNLVEVSKDSGVTTASYSALAVRDFAMVLLDNYETATGEVDDITINVIARSGDENLNEYLQAAMNSMKLFNKLFGKYPYETINVVFTDFFQGGMEYPNLVYISNSVENISERKKVIIHELAHQWWYGLVGNNEVDMAWFDEGLAEYSTLLYYENYPDEGVETDKLIEDTITSYELYLDVIGSLGLNINKSMELSLDEYLSEYEYVYMVYVKGSLFFDGLRETIGDDDFFAFLKQLVKNYKFKNIDKDGFLNLLNKVSGIEMNEYVNNWLSGKVDNFK